MHTDVMFSVMTDKYDPLVQLQGTFAEANMVSQEQKLRMALALVRDAQLFSGAPTEPYCPPGGDFSITLRFFDLKDRDHFVNQFMTYGVDL